MNNLAVAYGGREAGPGPTAFRGKLKLRKAKLGPDHPNTLTSMNNLAKGYHAAGKMDLALPLFLEAVAGLEKRGFQDEIAGAIVNSLIACHEQLKEFDQAEAWRRKWLAVVKDRSGPDSLPYAGELAASA